jgi:hypothetical protein
MRRSAANRFQPRHLGAKPGSSPGGGASKYNASRAHSSDGKSFASKAERDRYLALKLLEQAGLITELECQPKWTFPINGVPLMIGNRAVRYTADFRYTDKATGRVVVEDVKGMMTRDAVLRIAMLKAIHGVDVQLIGKQRRV